MVCKHLSCVCSLICSLTHHTFSLSMSQYSQNARSSEFLTVWRKACFHHCRLPAHEKSKNNISTRCQNRQPFERNQCFAPLKIRFQLWLGLLKQLRTTNKKRASFAAGLGLFWGQHAQPWRTPLLNMFEPLSCLR